jgi:hypothetical protein
MHLDRESAASLSYFNFCHICKKPVLGQHWKAGSRNVPAPDWQPAYGITANGNSGHGISLGLFLGLLSIELGAATSSLLRAILHYSCERDMQNMQALSHLPSTK